MIKWKQKPNGFCPVQSEGYFLGHYFYFRSRYEEAKIEFAKNEYHWRNDELAAEYLLMTTPEYEAGWLPYWKCKALIYLGCFLFAIKRFTNIVRFK